MARRVFTVRDVAEILNHWQAGRSIRAISRSLGASRPAIRKYISIANSHGFKLGGQPPPEGWQAFLCLSMKKGPTSGNEKGDHCYQEREVVRSLVAPSCPGSP